MLRATFQLGPGLGPRRERALWEAGVTDWAHFEDRAADLLPGEPGRKLCAAIGVVERAFETRDIAALAGCMPSTEHWRLYGDFAGEALFLDIETDADRQVTAVGMLDGRGPRVLLADRDLDRFPAESASARMLVTYNGAAFDVPVLRRAFPDWQPPAAHVDLCHVWRRLGARGGLKALEEEQGLARPPHLRGVTGRDAVWLWRRAELGDRSALRLFAEYNLYDVINLPTLLAVGYNRSVERAGLPTPPVPVRYRGDVLYDVTKVLLAL